MYNYNHTEDYLMHYGIKGQKWGVRRYQNKDGTLTEKGKNRASVKDDKKSDKAKKAAQLGAELAASVVVGYSVSNIVEKAGYGYGYQLAASALGGYLGMTAIDTLMGNR